MLSQTRFQTKQRDCRFPGKPPSGIQTQGSDSMQTGRRSLYLAKGIAPRDGYLRVFKKLVDLAAAVTRNARAGSYVPESGDEEGVCGDEDPLAELPHADPGGLLLCPPMGIGTTSPPSSQGSQRPHHDQAMGC